MLNTCVWTLSLLKAKKAGNISECIVKMQQNPVKTKMHRNEQDREDISDTAENQQQKSLKNP